MGIGFDFDPVNALFGMGLPIATFVLVILIYWKIKDIEKKLR